MILPDLLLKSLAVRPPLIRHHARWRSLVALLLLLLAGVAPKTSSAQDGERCFPETNQCISGAIRIYWEQKGGLPIFGYPISPLATETNGDAWAGSTQWFERDRLEDHGTDGVLAGRLGVEALEVQGMPWQQWPSDNPGGADCRFFPETNHTLCPPFRQYWERNGGVERFGYPISDVFEFGDTNGFNGPAQWFERRRMENHGVDGVLLGLLGKELYKFTAPHTPTACPSGATITVAPQRVKATDTLTINGRGFPSRANLQIGFYRYNADEGWTLGYVTTASDGTFQAVHERWGVHPTADGYVINPGRFSIAVGCGDDEHWAAFPINVVD